ncbi:hypothetical protein CMV_028114, partial [Castanea mollissima]
TTSHATPAVSLASSIRRCVHEDQRRLSLESTARIAWKLGQFIDDVWKRKDFDKLQILLQGTGVRTRVIITTHDKDVAIVASGKSIPLQLRSLTDKESWKLFFNNAHIPEDSLNDLVLISLKEKILRKCDGSPQAIIILAEGLVTPLPEQNMASEDPAEKYFKEIINRGLIEVALLRSDGSPETCHLPGILWDFFPKAVGSRLFHAHNTTDYTSAEPPKFNIWRLAEYYLGLRWTYL